MTQCHIFQVQRASLLSSVHAKSNTFSVVRYLWTIFVSFCDEFLALPLKMPFVSASLYQNKEQCPNSTFIWCCTSQQNGLVFNSNFHSAFWHIVLHLNLHSIGLRCRIYQYLPFPTALWYHCNLPGLLNDYLNISASSWAAPGTDPTAINEH